jgi:uncharacterized protein involved in exopolysaccharide biosynthesis
MKSHQPQENHHYNPEPDRDEGLDIHEYYRIVVKHKLLIILSLLLCVLLVGLKTYTMDPVYRATALVAIDSSSLKSPLSGEVVRDSWFQETSKFNTHARLYTSRPVLEKVVNTLGLLDEKPKSVDKKSQFWEFIKQLKDSIRIKENIKILLGREETQNKPMSKLDKAVKKLQGQIEVNPVRDTVLYEVSVEDKDPAMARDKANVLAESYIEFNIANHIEYSRNSFQWMSDQFYGVKKKLEDAERDFLNYKEQERLFSIEGRQDEILHKIRDMNDAYLQARNKRLELQANYQEIKSLTSLNKEDILQARSLLNTPLINSLYSQLLEVEMEQTRFSKVYKSKHPKMIQAVSEKENIQKKISEEIDKELANLESNISVLMAREEVLQQATRDYENDALKTNRKQLQYTILQRNMETNQKLHDTLLTKLKEADITDTMVISNIRVSEKAGLPNKPVRPNKKRNMMLSIIIGLMIGVGLAFLLEYLDRTIRTEEDIQRYLGLSVLSVVPKAEQAIGESYGKLAKKG